MNGAVIGAIDSVQDRLTLASVFLAGGELSEDLRALFAGRTGLAGPAEALDLRFLGGILLGERINKNVKDITKRIKRENNDEAREGN